MRDLEYQEAEEELNRLHDPVSLTIPVSQGPETVNLLSSDDSHPPPAPHPDLFPIGGLEGIPIANVAQDDAGVKPLSPMMERALALRKSRQGAPVEFVHGDSVHPTFNFGQAQASRPQAFNFGSTSAAPIGGPIQKDVWKNFPPIGDASARIPISTNVTSNVQNVKVYLQGLTVK